MQLVGQKVCFKDEKTDQHIIGEIINENETKVTIRWIMILEGKVPYSKVQQVYNKCDIDGKIKRITFNSLESGQQFLGNASEIYNQCVYVVGFDDDKMNCFKQRTNLYSEDASKERFAVWFVCNSNLCETGGSTHWKNIVSDDWNTITEFWINKSDEVSTSMSTRIIFIKKI